MQNQGKILHTEFLHLLQHGQVSVLRWRSPTIRSTGIAEISTSWAGTALPQFCHGSKQSCLRGRIVRFRTGSPVPHYNMAVTGPASPCVHGWTAMHSIVKISKI
ncbi:hypothetical protein PoB_006875300 [Plakobranchus ocellatus]|uniref:Uncharacterized protein n=1 Tax=Plakobranchus ocellatus TaxID=259542 RepID=A0AAV4DDW1_9GAST|nr:hypothetical protein PoB_006875300 [Plakobranchus ocellatus]